MAVKKPNTPNRFSTLGIQKDVVLKNRIVVSPMASETATVEGFASSKTTAHYAELAKSGAGLVMVEYSFVHSSGRSEEHQLGISSDAHMVGLTQIVQAIRGSGGPEVQVGIQLTHCGGKSDRLLTHGQFMGPSGKVVPVKDRDLEAPDPMTEEDIDQWKNAFIEGTHRAVLAGFDLVEFHSAHGYGLNQWLSPLTNHRSDRYGGTLKNRSRLLMEIVAETKAKFPTLSLAVRVPGQDFLPGGLSIEDMAQVSMWLEKAGLTILDVSSGMGGWRRPRDRDGEGYLVREAAFLQSHVSIPVIGVGGIQSGEYIDRVIGERQISLAAVGRAILKGPSQFRAELGI